MNGDDVFGQKVFLTSNIKTLDQLTLSFEGIDEGALIMRAAKAFFDAILALYPPPREVFVFCGPGNNGNDGRALAPLLQEAGYELRVYDLAQDKAISLPDVPDASCQTSPLGSCSTSSVFPLSPAPLLIDALFGAGLNRPIEGVAATWLKWMNAAPGIRMALDIPSGWHGEENFFDRDRVIFRARHTFVLDFPKLSFFFPESAPYVGEWQVVPLGLHPLAMASVETPYRMLVPERLCRLLPPLPRFLHKAAAGRIRLFAGSPGMMGAAALAVKAAYRTGAGWVQAMVPESEISLLQAMVPESVVRSAEDMPAADEAVFGAGPGLGRRNETRQKLKALLRLQVRPCVLDADALNILASDPQLWEDVPAYSVITPHPGEFERLAGSWENDFQRLQMQRGLAAERQIIVVLKGAFSSIAFPDGTVYFNTSGNPGMATAGSGDVLTGILLGLLGQGLSPQEAAVLGVYLHGLAGDLAAQKLGPRAVMASDIVDHVAAALQQLTA